MSSDTIDIPRRYVDFGAFVVLWYVLSLGVAVTAMFWLSTFVRKDLADYFNEITVLLFVIGVFWYMITVWSNFLGRAHTD